jgi:hypothetical protein
VGGGQPALQWALTVRRGEMMQHEDGCRRFHKARYLVYTAGVRLAGGALIAYMAATIVASGVAAETIEETIDAVNAGNGGTSTASGTSTLTTGDIYGGGNNGNTVIFGDIYNSTVEIDGGTVTNPTINILSMPAGTQIATADGGDDSQARMDEAGPPVDLDLDVRNTNRNSNDSSSSSSSSSTSNSTSNNLTTSNNINNNVDSILAQRLPPR